MDVLSVLGVLEVGFLKNGLTNMCNRPTESGNPKQNSV